MSRWGVLSVALLALSLAWACSESSNTPSCPAGYTKDTQGRCCDTTGRCVGDGTTECGPNAVKTTAGGCGCTQPFSDCNGDIGSSGGNGCECNGQCSGSQCRASNCNPATADCDSTSSFCDVPSATCQPCPAGTYDCDGLGNTSCEDDDASCGAGPGQCSPTAASSCGARDKYCDASKLECQPCPAGMHNCDGIGPCESTKDCAPLGCEQVCQDENKIYCVRDPSQGNLCRPCLEDAHCRANPSSRGPLCDTAKQLCYCKSSADCAGDRRGSLCKEAGSVMACGCDTDADCKVAEWSKCSPTVFGECIKPCKADQDCDDPSTETCDLESGICYGGV